ncbi:putative transcriptional regulator [Methanococcus maripaludis]|uniref:Putative transcriptional regulator n=1 Tax=Methanococcus maripaludis TaxID=39152 RepID=A0A7J9NVY9_METMI|nr:hypothetical protein [Methanococcus maripaludis]MBA2851850.1 putative transcriptional regulator [Methanococcus maripaludis]
MKFKRIYLLVYILSAAIHNVNIAFDCDEYYTSNSSIDLAIYELVSKGLVKPVGISHGVYDITAEGKRFIEKKLGEYPDLKTVETLLDTYKKHNVRSLLLVVGDIK